MTAAVQNLIDAFNALSPSEKQLAAAEILRRTVGFVDSDPRAATLVEAMDAVFGNLGISVREQQLRS
jgi:hypothetical protein